MMIEIAMTETGACRCYTLSTGKVTMTVSITPSFVTTCVDNAMARACRGSGKTFHGPDALTQAAAAYKSADARAMIEAVQQSERAIRGAATATAAA